MKREKKRGRRGEEEEEGEKFKQSSIKVWMLGFWYGNYLEYGFCMDHMNFKALYG